MHRTFGLSPKMGISVSGKNIVPYCLSLMSFMRVTANVLEKTARQGHMNNCLSTGNVSKVS
jgi:hypothetical protein